MKKDIPLQRLRLFVAAYAANPNSAEAARAAGYKGDAKHLSERAQVILKRADVKAMIDDANKQAQERAPGIMTRDERQLWWSGVIRGEVKFEVTTMSGDVVEVAASQTMRAKCSELLGKAQGDFIDRHEHHVSGRVEFIMQTPTREVLPEPDA